MRSSFIGLSLLGRGLKHFHDLLVLLQDLLVLLLNLLTLILYLFDLVRQDVDPADPRLVAVLLGKLRLIIESMDVVLLWFSVIFVASAADKLPSLLLDGS